MLAPTGLQTTVQIHGCELRCGETRPIVRHMPPAPSKALRGEPIAIWTLASSGMRLDRGGWCRVESQRCLAAASAAGGRPASSVSPDVGEACAYQDGIIGQDIALHSSQPSLRGARLFVDAIRDRKPGDCPSCCIVRLLLVVVGVSRVLSVVAIVVACPPRVPRGRARCEVVISNNVPAGPSLLFAVRSAVPADSSGPAHLSPHYPALSQESV